MVKGLDRFRDHFAGYEDRYVLIGGSALTLIMDEAGLPFRATRDLDIVLCIEALDQAFGQIFWDFIDQGQYEFRQQSTGSKQFYRFDKPEHPEFPETLELFSRKPDALTLPTEAHLTPIPVAEEASSLSAILLDPEYYDFIHAGTVSIQGLPVLVADRLIPLKAHAWIRSRELKASGVDLQRRDINKHRGDVFRLLQLLQPSQRKDLPARIRQDLERFIREVNAEGGVNPKDLGLGNQSLDELLDRLAQSFRIDR